MWDVDQQLFPSQAVKTICYNFLPVPFAIPQIYLTENEF